MAITQSLSEAALEYPAVLVKTLKTASDSPEEGGSSKISIAKRAWKDDKFFVPRKAEFLRDWILETWSRTSKR